MDALTLTEGEQLRQHEVVVERGLATFVEVGEALAGIRDGRLYRAEYATFEDYCQQRWGLAWRTAYRLMDAAAVVGNLSHGTEMLPTNERQTRPLTSLPPDVQREVWARAVETAPDSKVTAAHVERVVEDLRSGAIHSRMVMTSSESNEWYTPANIIDLAHAVMEGIDLDPASCEQANNVVKATTYYSIEDNGLSCPWYGRVWLNPPYGDAVGRFVDMLCAQFGQGSVSEAVLLVKAATDTDWFEPLFQYPICFIHGRVRFYNQVGIGIATFPSVVVYLGHHRDRFMSIFAQIGTVVERSNCQA